MFQDTLYKSGEGSLSRVWVLLQQSSGDSKFRFLSGEQKRGWVKSLIRDSGGMEYIPLRRYPKKRRKVPEMLLS